MIRDFALIIVHNVFVYSLKGHKPSISSVYPFLVYYLFSTKPTALSSYVKKDTLEFQ